MLCPKCFKNTTSMNNICEHCGKIMVDGIKLDKIKRKKKFRFVKGMGWAISALIMALLAMLLASSAIDYAQKAEVGVSNFVTPSEVVSTYEYLALSASFIVSCLFFGIVNLIKVPFVLLRKNDVKFSIVLIQQCLGIVLTLIAFFCNYLAITYALQAYTSLPIEFQPYVFNIN